MYGVVKIIKFIYACIRVRGREERRSGRWVRRSERGRGEKERWIEISVLKRRRITLSNGALTNIIIKKNMNSICTHLKTFLVFR